jgi:F-type H+-transporting ATPase subunit epsilon
MAKKTATLNVIARAPFELYYQGPAEVVSAENKIGPFDILPEHADFFSVLKPCVITIEKPEGDPVSFQINNGIITVRDDEVMLFCNM